MVYDRSVSRRLPDSAEFEPEPFRPAWWLPGAHAHTIAGRFLRPLDREPLRVERLELPDGDFIDLHEEPRPLPEGAPVVLILHGLEGCSSSNYVANLARELTSRGIRPIRFNFRGCSGEMNRLARFYHAGETGDLHHIVTFLRDRSPDTPLGAVGFSLGGNVLLKYLGEHPERAGEGIDAAAAVSVPFDLAAGTRRLEQKGLSRLYMLYFMRKLRRKARAKRELLAAACEVDTAIASRTIREYDDALTSRLHGFQDAWHYYAESSCAGFLSRVRVPTLVLHALDDPFLPEASVPRETIRENPFLIDATTPDGGHVGFISGPPWKPSFWAEREAARFMAVMLKAPSNVLSE